MVKTRIWTAALVLGLLLSLPAGCQVEDVEEESRIFAMDTVMTLTYYGQDRESGREAIEEGVAAVYELEDLLSATAPDSEISALNEGGQAHLSPDTAQLLSAALELCALTGGRWISQPTPRWRHGVLPPGSTEYPIRRSWRSWVTVSTIRK